MRVCCLYVLRAKHCGHVDDKVIGEACVARQIRIRLRGVLAEIIAHAIGLVQGCVKCGSILSSCTLRVYLRDCVVYVQLEG